METTDSEPALINVHKVYADKDIVNHFRLGDPKTVEHIFYIAKEHGKSEFVYQDKKHHLIRQDDGSYRVQPVQDRAMTEEWS